MKMYDELIYTGQVDFASRIRAIVGALGVLWNACNGWIVSGYAYGDTGDDPVAE
jgi:hypothetical protein